MKTILVVTEIPSSYKWVAQDRDGGWYVFRAKPSPFTGIGGGAWSNGKDVCKIGRGKPNKDWLNSLQKVEEVEVIE